MLGIYSDLNSVSLGIGAITLSASVWMGLRRWRETQTTADYLLAGRRLDRIRIGAHSLCVRSDMPGITSTGGISMFFASSFLAPILLTPIVYLLAPLFRRARFYSTADFFRLRFGAGLGVFYTIVAVIFMCSASSTIMSGMLQFARSSNSFSPIKPESLAYAASVAVLLYTTVGGLPSVVSAQLVQSVVVLALTSMIVFQASLHPVRIFSSAIAFPELTPGWMAAILFVAGLSLIAHPSMLALLSAGRTEADCRTGGTLGFILRRFRDAGVLIALGETLEPSRYGLLQSRFLASVSWVLLDVILLSALSSCLITVAALISRNLYKDYIRPAASDAQVLIVARASTLGIGILSISCGGWLAKYLVLEYLALTMAGFGLVIVLGTIWRPATAHGAFGSLIVMAALWITLGPIALANFSTASSVFGALGKPHFFPSLALVCLAMGVVSFIGISMVFSTSARQRADELMLRLRTPVGQEGRLVESGIRLAVPVDQETVDVDMQQMCGWKSTVTVIVTMLIVSLIVMGVFSRIA